MAWTGRENEERKGKRFPSLARRELRVSTTELKEMCDYYFDGKGKAFRPIIVALMARACNFHHNNSGEVKANQRSIALIAEMIHTATLVHDDVIDDANSRRGKVTVNQIWGERKASIFILAIESVAVLAGDFILSTASLVLARIGNTTVLSLITQVIEDLVRGEFLQLGSKENENERFSHYLEKTFKKTASLIAHSCKAVCTFHLFCKFILMRKILRILPCAKIAVSEELKSAASVSCGGVSLPGVQAWLGRALPMPLKHSHLKMGSMLTQQEVGKVSVLGCPDPKVHEIAYLYGKNLGIAFQLVDDVLDFTSCSEQLGKPASADLKLGIATGPVLFACQQFPEINAMIMRRFTYPGDVQRAQEFVLQSGGIQQTNYLAQRYCHEAVKEISKLRPSPERDALMQLAEIVLSRDK
ncbi:Decaprenyl-diphosphate synthase subunit 1, partial [Ophiophagus hannah]